jgi:hypothetical protein
MYTDPGSGLFFIQVIGAAVATVCYRLRRSLIAFVQSMLGGDSDPAN